MSLHLAFQSPGHQGPSTITHSLGPLPQLRADRPQSQPSLLSSTSFIDLIRHYTRIVSCNLIYHDTGRRSAALPNNFYVNYHSRTPPYIMAFGTEFKESTYGARAK
ncbi:hypothetical protein CDAR_583181 [Caerostris darwini]|uniref:Uncharacterized protein n=1 Tax=Caerostris darwini TaxID=1538125 RepID=A0AAV4STZ4_9ARAC|nr:hypothetical protein CDAR_583181 [Caerostris darwini]